MINVHNFFAEGRGGGDYVHALFRGKMGTHRQKTKEC